MSGLCLAAGAKLYHSGITWVDGERHAYMILERTFASTSASDGLRRWLAEHPGLLTLGASYTLFIEGAAAGSIYADLSTSSATLIRRIHGLFREKGIHVLDAPVSGGASGARRASLAVMVGGDEALYNRINRCSTPSAIR